MYGTYNICEITGIVYSDDYFMASEKADIAQLYSNVESDGMEDANEDAHPGKKRPRRRPLRYDTDGLNAGNGEYISIEDSGSYNIY